MAQDPPDSDRTEFTGPPAPVAARDATDPNPLLGTRIGPYLLVEALGEGGMGEVFLAEQAEPIRRRVALKLVRRQIVDAMSLAYFEIERQALARMEHPAIARVYDAGRTAQGYPYFAMEYVEGVTLGRWHEREQPALATTLRVFVALVRGVEHAHQRGIVPRDLKPDNVLVTVVDGLAQPKLIDFGIAIGIDADGAAARVNRAGSIDYMSPEQFASEHAAIDARSDVYSLGLILIGLIVPSLRVRGQPTQRPTELQARLRASIAGTADPDLARVPGELRHALARALAPDRERRYESAGAFADDVQRFIDGRPLHAVPRSRLYTLRKFVARNRASVALAGGVLLAVLAGLGATLWSLHQAEREAERARATSEFLSTILSSVDPVVARDLDKTLLRKVLDEAARRAERELRSQPEVRADIEGAIIGSYLGLGDVPVALSRAEAAYAWASTAFGVDAPATLRLAGQYADALTDDGKLAEAERLLRGRIAAASRTLGDDAETTLRLHHLLGIVLRDLGRADEAIPEFERSVRGLRTLLGADANPTASAEFALSIVLADKDRFGEAIAMLSDLIARQGDLKGIDHPDVLSMRNSLAVFHMQSRRYADGERVLAALLAPYAAQYGEDNINTLMVHGNLGGALRQQGKIAEAGPHYLRAMEGNRTLFGTDHPRSVMTLHNYGNWLLDAGQVAEADAVQTEALATSERVYKEPHPNRAEILTSLGKVRTREGRYDEAEKLLLESVALKTSLRGPDNSRLFQSREALRELYTAWQKPDLVARYAEPEKAPDGK